jgi:excisionase family DNA binding protein
MTTLSVNQNTDSRQLHYRRYLSIQEVADYLGIGNSTLRRLIANGIVPNYRIGGSIRIDIQELDKLIRDGKLELN